MGDHHPEAGSGLAAGQRAALARLVALACLGQGTRLAEAAVACRASGVPDAALREALRQVVPYAGFPRALTALGALQSAGLLPPTLPEAPEPDEAARRRAGRVAFEGVYGDTAERVRAGLARLDPLLPAWTEDFAYGRVIARPCLSLADREVLAVAALAALGGMPDPLLGHLRGALRLGVDREALAGVVAALPHEVPARARAEAEALLSRL